MHLVERLGLLVIGFKLRIANCPGGRDCSIWMLGLEEIALPQSIQGSTIKLRRPADELVSRTGASSDCIHEPSGRARRNALITQIIARLNDQDFHAKLAKPQGERAATAARTDDDRVIAVTEDRRCFGRLEVHRSWFPGLAWQLAIGSGERGSLNDSSRGPPYRMPEPQVHHP